MGLLRPRAPVSESARLWIDESLSWLLQEFGPNTLGGEVMLPSQFSFAFTPTGEPDLAGLLDVLCGKYGVDANRVDLELLEDYENRDLAEVVPVLTTYKGFAGHYAAEGERFRLTVGRELFRRPVSLIATLAHELAHVKLLGEGRVTTAKKDHEQLTDLATVYFGAGIFTANAAVDHVREVNRSTTWTLGYLSEAMFGYALAKYAQLRGEDRPAWAKLLDTNPLGYMRQGERYLRNR